MNKLETNKVYIGDCFDVLKTFPSESIDMCITSPPYWGLRDYGVNTQLGLEKTPEQFIDKLCDVFDEVKRVLKPNGSCWVNIGDSYHRGTRDSVPKQKGIKEVGYKYEFNHKKKYGDYYRPKSLIQIPSRFSIEMTNRGWILRNEIIWHKPSCLPASVKDRFTVDFEKMFFFTKNPNYYFKQQLEPVKEKSLERAQYSLNQTDNPEKAVNVQNMNKMGTRFVNPKGRNKRTVWSINTAKLRDAHFAVYPLELLRSPIDAGCPEGGIVLDPFFGSGTTAEVAMEQNKEWIGIEINPEYEKISRKRLKPKITEKKQRDLANEFWDTK